jgi:hypothetical protein
MLHSNIIRVLERRLIRLFWGQENAGANPATRTISCKELGYLIIALE